jgi:hypothetical protein
MIKLPLNWINFFHNTQLQNEAMQKIFNYISMLSAGTFITIEEITRQASIPNMKAIETILSLEKSNLITINLKCPECNENIEILNELIIDCKYCENEINILTLPIARINYEASLVNIFLNEIDENCYETNARILERIGKEKGILYYLITDIKSSQIQQEDNPIAYSLILNQLWSEFWPQVMHIAKKASLPLLAKGDAVSWVFIDKEDMLNTIKELGLYLSNNHLTKLSVYGSEIPIPSHLEILFMRSLDKKWDLNTPTITKLYRKAEYKQDIWENIDDYVLKFWLFDEIAEFVENSHYCFLKNGKIIEYNFIDKHNFTYKGKCFTGYINAKIINIDKEPPHA